MTALASDGWIVRQLQVRLAGRVIAADGGIASGGRLTLRALQGGGPGKAKSYPAAFTRQFDTPIRADGFYFFANLPAGDYVLEGQDEHGNQIEPRHVTVPAKQVGAPDIVALDLTVAARSGSEEPSVSDSDVDRSPALSVRRRRGSRRRPAKDPRG
jgi:hypothetical protein